MNRRDFMKVLGISGAAGAVACDPRTPIEHVLPYVVPPEDIVPGNPTLYATVCDGCSASCGMLAHNREGRVVHVSGNPDNPAGGGNLCPTGQALHQDTYDPDRLDGPRKGGRPLGWDEAIGEVAGGLSGRVAWLGRYRTGSLDELVGRVIGGLGGRRVHWEPLGYASLARATEAAFGIRDRLPRYELAEAHTIVSFGADFLHTWLAPVDHSRGWKKARDPEHGGVVAAFYALEPRVSATSAKADTWWAVRPGTELQAALALARLVSDRKGGVAGGWLRGVDAAKAAAAAGIPLAKLTTLAERLANGGPSVILPGGPTSAATDGTDLALATLVLNAICGNLGRTVLLGSGHRVGQADGFADVVALLADCRAGKVDTLFIDGLDLAYLLPGDVEVVAALAAVRNLYVFSNLPLEGLPDHAVILPPGSALECWEDPEPRQGVHGLRQAVVEPRGSRSVGDVLLQAARKAGIQEPAPEEPTEEPPPSPPTIAGQPAVASLAAHDFQRFIAGRWHRDLFPRSGAADFRLWWESCLRRGGFFEEVAEDVPALRDDLPPPRPARPPAGDLALLVFPHPKLRDGRHANKAWLQEVADGLSGFTWGTWAELSPATARRLGVEKAERVRVTTAAGTIEAAVRISKGMRDDAVAVVLGNGHEAGNRYMVGYGANPVRLLASSTDPRSGELAWVGTTATVARTGQPSGLSDLKGSEDMDDRPVALTAYAPAVIRAGGKGEPGSLVDGLHHVPEDPRLVERGIHDMYPEPEHPVHRFAMAVDLDACTGCGACQVACYSENNIPVVGPQMHARNRQMTWIRLDRFWEGEGEHPDVRFAPVMCQQCSHAPCEPVCPVLATYHNQDGLNAMVYNRCVGTRYCANNCPYSARRFNFHTYRWPESYKVMLNPDVSTREMGVMEKCTFCVQRIRRVKAKARNAGRPVPREAWENLTACASACPSDAIVFGDLLDEESAVARAFADPRAYTLFGELNTKPGVRYLARLSFQEPAHDRHGGGHGEGGGHGATNTDHGRPS